MAEANKTACHGNGTSEVNGHTTDDSLNQEQKLILEEFRQLLKDVLKPDHDHFELLRFLEARNFNLEKAERMFRENLKFRKNLDLDSITGDSKLSEVFEKYYSLSVIGCDKEGDVVVVHLGGEIDFKGFVRCYTHADRIKVTASSFEKAMAFMREQNKCCEKKGRKLVCIFDMDAFNIFSAMDKLVIKYFIEIAQILADNYPQVLKNCFVLNASPYMITWVNMMKVFMDPHSASKLHFYGKDDNWKEVLLEHIDADVLPAFLGGTRTDPDGNTNCCTLFVRQPKIPTSYYLDPDVVEMEPGMTEVDVEYGSFHNHVLVVKEVQSRITWFFRSQGYNIKFGIYRALTEGDIRTSGKQHAKDVKKELNGDNFEVVVPLQLIESHRIPERGELICEKRGKYILHFDNTFSVMTSKQLFFKADVIPPSAALEY